MKKLFPAVLLCGCLLGRAALAQPTRTVALMVAKPAGIGSAMSPRGARLLRSGSAFIGRNGAPAWLLFYGRKPGAKAMETNALSEEAMQVDLKKDN